MDFGTVFALNLLFLSCFDSCWLALNFRLLPEGYIYPKTARSTHSPFITIVFCFLCWSAAALYLAGHQYDTLWRTAVEGAWTGCLVYSVFNCTTFIMNADWPLFPTAMIDLFWGTALFAVSSVLSATIAGYN